MKFKVGDMVRVTREGLAKQAEHSFVKSSEISGWEIQQIIGNKIYCPNNEYWYEEKYLELVPKEPEFEYGEIVEVYSPNKKKRRKRFFICEAHGARYPYICVDLASEDSFKNGKKFQTNSWGKIRKLPHQLTRKEIADHFGVSENFILIDDVNANEV